jgi:hypothetical protein
MNVVEGSHFSLEVVDTGSKGYAKKSGEVEGVKSI